MQEGLTINIGDYVSLSEGTILEVVSLVGGDNHISVRHAPPSSRCFLVNRKDIRNVVRRAPRFKRKDNVVLVVSSGNLVVRTIEYVEPAMSGEYAYRMTYPHDLRWYFEKELAYVCRKNNA
jgi:hypothetical protein